MRGSCAMRDERKTKAQLSAELRELHAAQEASENAHRGLREIRDRIWAMRDPAEIDDLLPAIGKCLEGLSIPIQDFGVNVVDPADPAGTSFHVLSSGGHLTAGVDAGGELVHQIWREGKTVCRRFGEGDDAYGEGARLEALFGHPVRSVIDMPFSRGTLAANSAEEDAFTERGIVDLEAVADVLSEGFQRMEELRLLEQSNRELEEKTRLMASFQEVSETMISSLRPEEAMERLAQGLVQAGALRSLMVAVVDEQQRKVEVVGNYLCPKDGDGKRVPGAVAQPVPGAVELSYSLDDENITAQVARTGKMAVIEGRDARLDPRSTNLDADKVAYFIPVVKEGRVLAVVATASDRELKAEMLRRIDLMQSLLNHVAIALEQTRLYEALRSEIAERQHAEEGLRREYAIREAENAVRVAIAAMAQPEDLASVTSEIEGRLRELGLAHDSFTIQILSKDNTGFCSVNPDTMTNNWDLVMDVVSGRRCEQAAAWAIRYPWVIEAWRSGESRCQAHIDLDPVLPGCRDLFIVDAPFLRGTLAVNRPRPGPFTPKDVALLERFAAVLSDGFQRFLDLTERKRAEDATRWAAAQDRVRVGVFQMVKYDDIQGVAVAVREALHSVGVPLDGCSVQLIDERRGRCVYASGAHVLTYDLSDARNEWLQHTAVWDAWTSGDPVYRPDLLEEDKYGALSAPVDRVMGIGHPCVVDAPFSRGTVAMNATTPNAFTDADIEKLSQLGGILSEAYVRFEAIVAAEEALAALRESEDRFSRFFHSSPAGLVITTLEDGRVLDVNRSFEAITGYGGEENAGRTLGAAGFWNEPGDREAVTDKLRVEGAFQDMELRFRHRSGETRSGLVSAEIVNLGDERCIITALSDITARRQAERALLQSSRLIALGQMAAGMAHELNQPLTVISAMAEGLQIRLEQGIEMTPERLQRWSADVMEGVERMSSIIEHLRTFSRDRSGLPDEKVEINDVVRGALTITQAQLKSQGIEVALDLAEDLAPVSGDQYRLEQVLINLVHNGRDAVAERREQLSDSDGDGWQMRLDIRTRREDDQVVLEVEDNGVGMGEEARLQVLEPFFTTKGPDRGTGLGLSISHAILSDHRGEIECESEEGEGTVFRVRLPLRE